jgi:DNA-binding LacI/PurR family transcriptional regulator
MTELSYLSGGVLFMKRRKIAILLGQAEESYQHRFISGASVRASKLGFDVYAFSMFIKYQNNKEREEGDSNIFNLINYKEFDAIIVLSDTIQTPGVENKIEEKLHERFSGPVVCIDTDSQYFYNFWTDGYSSVYATISHLIEKHGVKDIAYLTGRKNHVHSQKRLEAYKQAMLDHQLEVNDDRIFYEELEKLLADEKVRGMFRRQTQGSECFQRFYILVEGFGYSKAWELFQSLIYEGVAREWCRENGILVAEDEGSFGS